MTPNKNRGERSEQILLVSHFRSFILCPSLLLLFSVHHEVPLQDSYVYFSVLLFILTDTLSCSSLALFNMLFSLLTCLRYHSWFLPSAALRCPSCPVQSSDTSMLSLLTLSPRNFAHRLCLPPLASFFPPYLLPLLPASPL